jgi:ABC-type antimicrobial peptide transport system permease subunit
MNYLTILPHLLLETFNSLLVGIQMAAIEMWGHKLRSFLSVLGVLLGVASLVAMLTLVSGIDVFLHQKIGRWAGMLSLMKKWDMSLDERIAAARSPGIRYSDGNYLADASPQQVGSVMEYIDRKGTVIVAGDKDDWIKVHGVGPATWADEMENLELAQGRWLDDNDYELGTKNCVISWWLEERIVPRLRKTGKDSLDLVGTTLSFRNVRFTIVGSFRPKDPDVPLWHLRRTVTIPIRTMQRYLSGLDPDPGAVQLYMTDPTQLEAQAQAVSRALTTRHRGVQDFDYHTSDWVEQITSMFKNISLLMSIIAAVALLVGGLGIMNVMLSSISERIKEIGVRKALGATNFQIFVQFIAETTTLSCMGGVAGAALGCAPLFFKEAIAKSTGGAIAPTLLPVYVLLTFIVIVAVGIVFGLYPALKASRMNPVDALRYE